jgi:hypothetical protein
MMPTVFSLVLCTSLAVMLFMALHLARGDAVHGLAHLATAEAAGSGWP